MASTFAPLPVPAPRAGAPRIGLIASGNSPQDEGDRWLNGITYKPEGCVEGTTLDPCDVGEQDIPSSPNTVVWHPYELTLEADCSTFSGTEGWEERITRALAADEERQLGAELWDGALAQSQAPDSPNTWLANEPFDNLTESGAVGLVHGLACLDNYLLTHNGGQQGMIHCTGQTFVHWASFRLFRWVGNQALSPLDNIVVASPGYSGNSPLGVVGDDDVWAYATDMVQVRLGEVEKNAVVDRRQNTVIAKAHRRAMAEWELCRHAGVQLAMSLCDPGGS